MSDPAIQEAIYVGQGVRLTATFYINDDITDVADPTTIEFKVKDPSANVATYTYAAGTVARLSEGVYEVFVEADEAGTWNWLVEAEGTVDVVNIDDFLVTATGF